jgi:hypothetical protein
VYTEERVELMLQDFIFLLPGLKMPLVNLIEQKGTNYPIQSQSERAVLQVTNA